jgi:hypothetical protein
MSDHTGPIVDELSRVAERLFGILPELLAAIIILVGGWLIARLLRALTIRFASVANRMIARLGVHIRMPVGAVRDSSTRVFGEIVFWLVILVFLTAATSVLGLQVFTGWLERLVGYLPKILSGLLIIFAASSLPISRATVCSLRSAMSPTANGCFWRARRRSRP